MANFLATAKPSTRVAVSITQRPRMMKRLRKVALSLIAFLFAGPIGAVQSPDEEYQSVAEEYIKGYMAARPLLGTSLGLHEYDGKIADFSRLSLDAELARLRRFDDRLSKFDLSK